jgi:hypothetical protein
LEVNIGRHFREYTYSEFTALYRDFGELSCLAMNEMGSMKEGDCVFQVTAAGPPHPPAGCLILNQTTDLLQVYTVHQPDLPTSSSFTL